MVFVSVQYLPKSLQINIISIVCSVQKQTDIRHTDKGAQQTDAHAALISQQLEKSLKTWITPCVRVYLCLRG